MIVEEPLSPEELSAWMDRASEKKWNEKMKWKNEMGLKKLIVKGRRSEKKGESEPFPPLIQSSSLSPLNNFVKKWESVSINRPPHHHHRLPRNKIRRPTRYSKDKKNDGRGREKIFPEKNKRFFFHWQSWTRRESNFIYTIRESIKKWIGLKWWIISFALLCRLFPSTWMTKETEAGDGFYLFGPGCDYSLQFWTHLMPSGIWHFPLVNTVKLG